MSDTNKDLDDLAKNATDDFYELLGVHFDSTESEIKRAYRKTSIKYHPDKNPDSETAADTFIRLGHARDILIDAKLKAVYDGQRLRRKEKALQDDLLDGRRRKMKEDLERRERAGAGMKRKRMDDLSEAEKLEMEIQRLAEDGKRRRKEQQEKLERRRQEEEASFMEMSPEVETKPQAPGQTAEIDRTIKVRFQREGVTASWDKEQISDMFAKYGKVDSVVMGKDKKIRPSGEKHRKVMVMAFVIYTRMDHAHAAVSDAKGHYPLLESVAWASKEPEIKSPVNPEFSAPSTPQSTPNKSFRASFNGGLGKGFGSVPGTPKFSFSPKTPSLEEVTMIRLKQAEKKRLEEQIRQKEAAEEALA
ncbi:DnaJ-domain-containing protein [Melanomma pulvis-pyrius CBS 109.77]|uniref:DnaJ-domain-containing protein n=1 Tax=Melanomma pulvis-pyrius CBS 109.77 TaxID=1314802 RepID=A0A6A6X426_9PLEO|nr:DnaJ-domain-containing protein [Melanomma pulvis-pyrius CBS 109.77]